MGVGAVAGRWQKAGRALGKDEKQYASKLAQMAKRHSSGSFYALDDPLEAAVFSVLIEIMKELDRRADGQCGSSTRDTTDVSSCGHVKDG